jgi:zinc/manganese transport system permease protein
MSGLQLMLPPFVACMVLVAMLSYLGLHVIAREVIFVDLSLAQIAALGSLVALLFHVGPDSPLRMVFALAFTAVGAFLFAITRTARGGRVPQEAIIGIVYVVASAAAILVADKVPGGGEEVEKSLVGSILWVTWPTIGKLAAAFAALGAFQYALRRTFLTISFHAEEAERQGWRVRWWDFWFYLSFGIVITLAVPVGGVLMVFTFLVVPAVIAFLFTRDMRRLAYIAWGSGAVASSLGLWLSFTGNLPTGPVIVCMYGLLLAAVAAVRAIAPGVARRRDTEPASQEAQV